VSWIKIFSMNKIYHAMSSQGNVMSHTKLSCIYTHLPWTWIPTQPHIYELEAKQITYMKWLWINTCEQRLYYVNHAWNKTHLNGLKSCAFNNLIQIETSLCHFNYFSICNLTMTMVEIWFSLQSHSTMTP
jgi:hypothetical protein